jgi:hypothetical protein
MRAGLLESRIKLCESPSQTHTRFSKSVRATVANLYRSGDAMVCGPDCHLANSGMSGPLQIPCRLPWPRRTRRIPHCSSLGLGKGVGKTLTINSDQIVSPDAESRLWKRSFSHYPTMSHTGCYEKPRWWLEIVNECSHAEPIDSEAGKTRPKAHLR